MKKLFSLVLSVVVLLGCFTTVPVFASASSAGDLGTGVYWSYDSGKKTLRLSGDGEIPFFETQRSIPWWNHRNEITNVAVEEGITTVASLEKLSQLKEISLPDSATEIEGSAFYGCYSLETVNLSKNTKNISNHAFDGCESLKTFTINGDVNGKGSPFTDSTGNITGDGYFVRDGILFANYNTYIDNNLSVKKIKHNSLIKYPSGRTETSYVIPNTTMEIKSGAFSSVKNLQTITIPSSVVSFYVRSFVGYGENFEKPLTLVFQHDVYLKDAACSAIQNLVSGSRIIVKNETVKKTFCDNYDNFIYNDNGAQNVTIVANPNPTTNLTITSAPKTLTINETGVVEVAQTPYNTTDNITFTSSDETIVSFDKYICGQITAHKPGTATITVTSGSVSRKHTITVTCTHPKTHITNTVSPTCSKAGYTGDTACVECGTVITKGTSIPKIAHSYGNWINELEATCTEFGVSYRKCNSCGDIEYKYIEELGHTFSSEWTVDKQPTCISEGSKSNHCIHCEKRTNITVIPASNHDYSDWFVEIEVSPDEFGIESRRCNFCGEVNYKYIEYINGEFHYMILDSDNEVLEEGTCPEKAHRSSDWIIDKDPSCSEAGSKHKECVFCGVSLETEVLPALGHTSSNWITDNQASVTSAGSKHKECVECGEILETTVISQLKCATPKLTKASNTVDGVKVTWETVDGADSYRVYRRAGSVYTWSFIGTSDTTSFTDTEAQNNKYWIYTVIAVNEAGYSGFDKTGKTIKCVFSPKVTGVSNTANGLYVKWNVVPGAKEYRVYRKGLNYNSWMYLGTTKNTWFTDNPIKNANGYYYKYTVIAVNDYYSGFYEDCAFTKRLSNPVLKSAVSTKAGVTVKWNSVYGSTGYYVYRKTAGTGWKLVGSAKGTNNASYVDKTAQKGVTYTYTVRAYYGKTLSSYNASGITTKDLY